jgi:hypothetical protein
MGKSLVIKVLDKRNNLSKISLFVILLSSLVPAQVIIKEKVEINPQRISQPESGIGGDVRNPVYIRYGGNISIGQDRAVSGGYELWEETLGKVANTGLNGLTTELGAFPQWHKFVFYLFNP